jgi:hypothetical protein
LQRTCVDHDVRVVIGAKLPSNVPLFPSLRVQAGRREAHFPRHRKNRFPNDARA